MRPHIPSLDFHACQISMFLWPITSSNRAAITVRVSDIFVGFPNLLSVFPLHLGACYCGLKPHLRDEAALATFRGVPPAHPEFAFADVFIHFLDSFMANGPGKSFSNLLHFLKKNNSLVPSEEE